VDIVHPAHVHFFKHMVAALEERGIRVTIAARAKDVTLELLDRYGLDYETLGAPGKGRLKQASELLTRDLALARLAKRCHADLILTRNPSGAQVGRLLGIRSIFDTDDGPQAGVHYWAAAPFAHVITTPDCTPESYGKKHVKYPGYKQTAYLHPNHFTPDPRVLGALGVDPGERYFIVRFVAMQASHDSGESGLAWPLRRKLVERLGQRGKVFISSESELPGEFQAQRFAPPPHLLHDALAFSALLVGDSQTMAAEAAVLGTPCLHVSSFSRRLDYLRELELEYGLIASFRPEDETGILSHLDALLAGEDPRTAIAPSHARMLREKCDVTRWFVDFVANQA
jgi:predicted glycosyltransferase